MKILVIGSDGSTGRRYCKIMEEMGVSVLKYDIRDVDSPLPSCDKVIIATPTETHQEYYYMLPMYQETDCHNILIEQPAVSDISDLIGIEAKMVCNWAFVFPDRILQPGKNLVNYSCNYTGKEGYWFNTCQLHILSNGRGIIAESADTFNATIGGYVVTRSMIEASYFRMIDAWIYRPEELWNVQDLIPELSYIIRKQEIENGQK